MFALQTTFSFQKLKCRYKSIYYTSIQLTESFQLVLKAALLDRLPSKNFIRRVRVKGLLCSVIVILHTQILMIYCSTYVHCIFYSTHHYWSIGANETRQKCCIVKNIFHILVLKHLGTIGKKRSARTSATTIFPSTRIRSMFKNSLESVFVSTVRREGTDCKFSFIYE